MRYFHQTLHRYVRAHSVLQLATWWCFNLSFNWLENWHAVSLSKVPRLPLKILLHHEKPSSAFEFLELCKGLYITGFFSHTPTTFDHMAELFILSNFASRIAAVNRIVHQILEIIFKSQLSLTSSILLAQPQ